MRLFLAAITSLMITTNAFALEGSSSISSGTSGTTTGSSTMQHTPLLEKATPKQQPHTTASPTAPVVATPQSAPLEATYFYPGIIAYRNGTWVGGDNLLNLPKNIGLYINIIKPSSDTLEINEEQFLRDAQRIFEKANIAPRIMATSGQPPLPFFQVQVLLYPVERGYAASCEGRLFESVNMQRVILEQSGMAYQAVTWQKSSLIVSPKEKILDQLKVDIEDIVQSFADRYVTFENIKNNLK